MDNYFYENYTAVFTPEYVLSDLIEEFDLKGAEIVQMFREDKVKRYTNSKDLYYRYQIIFKIPRLLQESNKSGK